MLKGTQHMEEEEEDDDDDDDLGTRRRSIFFGTYMCVYIYIERNHQWDYYIIAIISSSNIHTL